MKKPGVLTIIWLLAAIAVIIYCASRFVTNVDERSTLEGQQEFKQQIKPWYTYEYQNRKIVSRESNRYEIGKAGIPGKAIDIEQSFRNRGLLKPNGASYMERLPVHRKFVNEYKKEWMKNFAQRVLRFQDPSTKLLVTHLGGYLIWRPDNTGQYVEQVELVLLLPDGKTSSAQSLVDSESGRPLRYWNRSQHESNLQEKLTLSIDASSIAKWIKDDDEDAPPSSSLNRE